MTKQTAKAPKHASGVVKRGIMEKTVTKNTSAEIAKVTIWPPQNNVRLGKKKNKFKRSKQRNV
jgi:hypothetical protein